MAETTRREVVTGNVIAISSLIFFILLIIHNFFVLDTTTVKSLLSLAGQKTTTHSVNQVLNSFRFDGIMYLLAYLAGVIAYWNRHPYLWWFMFAVYISNAFFTLVNLYMVVQGILEAKNVIAAFPTLIVVIGSLILAAYMLIVSIKRKSTFNR
ncbi:hypothetical protein SAMN03097721_00059 [Staphylococcus pasteuri]|uniref:DUF2127 domain-containing protein n=1 Tax=Staphylococcus pasteuri TaxID=45972 RepID=A0ABY1H2L9_9STAP|nr:hypothetical protein [Staphylococcus pasteuri]KKI56828.1 hypothetical protein UF70_0471 [Staphylococcus pasteuri]MDI3233141.1 hypothetical protein [Staphylococcus pasteuri]SFZ71047.1 hypothetical protein SAMN03097721_00059 [Staphylococcus pasteuri]